jgi:hypothetical protein
LDFKNNFFILPAQIGDAADLGEGAFELEGFFGEKFLQLNLDEEVIFAFAVEATGGGSRYVIKVGNAAPAIAPFDWAKALEAPILAPFFRIGCVDQIVIIYSIKGHKFLANNRKETMMLTERGLPFKILSSLFVFFLLSFLGEHDRYNSF